MSDVDPTAIFEPLWFRRALKTQAPMVDGARMSPRMVLPLCALAAALVSPVAAHATPVNTTPPSISTPVSQVGAPFSVDPGTWTGAGPLRYLYFWTRCVGPNPADCNKPAAGDDGDYYIPPTGTVRVYVTVTVIDSTNSGTMVNVNSGLIVPQDADASGTTTLPVPLITPSGTGQTAGTVFTANRGSWSPEASSYEFRWFRCDVAAARCRYLASTAPGPGALTSTYTSVAADAGSQLEVLITGIAASGTRTSRFGGPTPSIMPVALAPIAPIAPAPIARLPVPSVQKKPKLSGPARVGRKLKLNRGTWLYASTFPYRWLRNGTRIKGAIHTTYRLRRADRGKRVSCRVTAANVIGSTTVRTRSVRIPRHA
jgi:hypothetical protein